MSMELLFFQSDGMSDAEVLGILDTLKVQRKRWIAGFHPDSRIRKLAFESSGVKVGAGTHFSIGTVVLDAYKNNVSIGERVAFGPHVILISASGPNDSLLNENQDIHRAIKTAPITIGDDAWIGAGVIVMPGVSIGAKSVIGAGAVVTKNVSAGEVITGVPGRVARTLR